MTTEETIMRTIKTVSDVPGFPLIPFVPMAIVVGSLIASIRALVLVRRIQRMLAEPPR